MMLEGLTGITKSSYTGDDLINRHNIKYHTQLEAMGNGQYEEVEVAYKNDIESLPSADRPTGWIPVSERLPEVDVEVLTTTDWSDVLIAWLNKDCAWETEELILDNDEILAWMPLPEPYKGGDTE